MDVKGKVAVITGAGSGIGRATAERLAAEGAAIVVADLDAAMGKETVDRIEGKGGRATFVLSDVAHQRDARGMCEAAVERFGAIHIFHNNAGIGVGPPGYPNVSLEQWRRVLEVDLYAVILGCYVAAPLIERSGGGVIVNTASMAGLYPYPLDPIYAAAKAGVVNFTYSLAPWAAERKIRVNCVCPGVVDTPMVRRGQAERAKAGLPPTLPAKVLQPEQIADAVITLISDDSLYGRVIEVRPTGPRLVETPTAPGARR